MGFEDGNPVGVVGVLGGSMSFEDGNSVGVVGVLGGSMSFEDGNSVGVLGGSMGISRAFSAFAASRPR